MRSRTSVPICSPLFAWLLINLNLGFVGNRNDLAALFLWATSRCVKASVLKAACSFCRRVIATLSGRICDMWDRICQATVFAIVHVRGHHRIQLSLFGFHYLDKYRKMSTIFKTHQSLMFVHHFQKSTFICNYFSLYSNKSGNPTSKWANFRQWTLNGHYHFSVTSSALEWNGLSFIFPLTLAGSSDLGCPVNFRIWTCTIFHQSGNSICLGAFIQSVSIILKPIQSDSFPLMKTCITVYNRCCSLGVCQFQS